MICNAPGVPAMPDRPTVAFPPVVFMPIESANVPSAVGSKLTSTVIDAPAAIWVPGAGTPLALNGAAGSCTELIVSGAEPMLLKTAVPDRWPPTVVPPIETTGGLEASSGPAA